jgi:hypothetical protein
MEQRLSLITLGVEDVGRSKQFYERLGWKASSAGNDEVAFFQLGGVVLSLYGLNDFANDAGVPAGDGNCRNVAIAYNTRQKYDVDSALQVAERAGARILKPAEDTFWGGYVGYFTDPDGHIWEVAWNPGFEINDDGSVALPS